MAYKESLPDQLMEIVNQARRGENIENEEREKKEEKEKDREDSKRKEEDAVVHTKNEEQSKAVDCSKSVTTTEGKEKEKEPTLPQTTTTDNTTHPHKPNKEEGHHVVIKLQDAKGDLRRFSLPIGEKNAGTFWNLFGLLEAELKIKEELSVHSSGLFQLKYIDDEGDKITILTGTIPYITSPLVVLSRSYSFYFKGRIWPKRFDVRKANPLSFPVTFCAST